MIVDLLAPVAFSVNDSVDADLCSLRRYASVDDSVELIQRLGWDTQLVMMDLKDAYRVIPVHPDNHHILGIRWQDEVFLDRSSVSPLSFAQHRRSSLPLQTWLPAGISTVVECTSSYTTLMIS